MEKILFWVHLISLFISLILCVLALTKLREIRKLLKSASEILQEAIK